MIHVWNDMHNPWSQISQPTLYLFGSTWKKSATMSQFAECCAAFIPDGSQVTQNTAWHELLLRACAFTYGRKRREGGRRDEVSYVKKLFIKNKLLNVSQDPWYKISRICAAKFLSHSEYYINTTRWCVMTIFWVRILKPFHTILILEYNFHVQYLNKSSIRKFRGYLWIQTSYYNTEFSLFCSLYIQFILILYTVGVVKATNYSVCQ